MSFLKKEIITHLKSWKYLQFAVVLILLGNIFCHLYFFFIIFFYVNLLLFSEILLVLKLMLFVQRSVNFGNNKIQLKVIYCLWIIIKLNNDSSLYNTRPFFEKNINVKEYYNSFSCRLRLHLTICCIEFKH